MSRKDDKEPLPPDVLVDAKQDQIHRDPGGARPAFAHVSRGTEDEQLRSLVDLPAEVTKLMTPEQAARRHEEFVRLCWKHTRVDHYTQVGFYDYSLAAAAIRLAEANVRDMDTEATEGSERWMKAYQDYVAVRDSVKP